MLQTNDTGLVVIDIQGNLAHQVFQSEALLHNTLTLINAAQILAIPNICLEQAPLKLGPTVPLLAEELTHHPLITKHTFNACDTQTFVDTLHDSQKDNWLVCGIEAHVCVYQTVLGMLDLGYHVEVVSDAVSSRAQENKALAIEKLSARGASITSVEMALFELIKDCRSPAFKTILPLIK
ncbi:isochorismatase hydrolase [Paraglaciecola sp. T6c]|uniref:hydrolase n=1 Tax=Pseudoalteromonas atlantica (strain T6c / ATCC BAA-1087) TaxID=3042615 RepID=UPI00005C6955|nr:hydrolase [Paraglaciecola sp. T6c]ABG40284.1 isochorismatase hydrolase [Paraglaciecola sp. T6c]